MRPLLSPIPANDLSLYGACLACGSVFVIHSFGDVGRVSTTFVHYSFDIHVDDERAIYSLKSSKQPPCTIPYVVSSTTLFVCVHACRSHNIPRKCTVYVSAYVYGSMCVCAIEFNLGPSVKNNWSK